MVSVLIKNVQKIKVIGGDHIKSPEVIMTTKYESEVKMMKSLKFFSEIEDIVMPVMLNIMMEEHLTDDTWMTSGFKAGLKTNLTMAMIRIDSRYHCMLNQQLFDDDAIGAVEEFKLFASKMCKYDGVLKTIMESDSKEH